MEDLENFKNQESPGNEYRVVIIDTPEEVPIYLDILEELRQELGEPVEVPATPGHLNLAAHPPLSGDASLDIHFGEQFVVSDDNQQLYESAHEEGFSEYLKQVADFNEQIPDSDVN